MAGMGQDPPSFARGARRCAPVPPLLLLLTAFLLLAGAICALPSSCAATLLPGLATLEPLTLRGPEVLAALAELERDEQLLREQEARMGPKLFAGATFGVADEPLNDISDVTASYRKGTVRGGVAFPLLGTWNREKIDTLRRELQALQTRTRTETLFAQNLTALRKAYAVLWIEARREALLRTALAEEETVLAALTERRSKGLLLEGDRLEFVAGFDLLRQELAAAALRRTKAMNALRLATGTEWELPDVPAEPALPVAAPEVAATLEEIVRLPELRHREEHLAVYRRLFDAARKIGPEGTLEVGVAGSRNDSGGTGSSAYLGITLLEPFGGGTAAKAAAAAASADLRRAALEGTVRRIGLEGELMETLALFDYAAKALATAETRLSAAMEALRERRLRHGVIAGDTFEKMQQGRNASVRGALETLDAEALLLQTYIELLRFAYPGGAEDEPPLREVPLPGRERRERLLAPEGFSFKGASVSGTGDTASPSLSIPGGNPAPRATHRAPLWAYVWEGAAFLDPDSRESALALFRDQGFSRMLLSFSGAEVERLAAPATRKILAAFLASARSQGVAVYLLLGDPEWILPAFRNDLFSLLRFFSGFSFAGIHLDLEPDSLEEAETRREALLGDLLATLREVRRRFPKPLGISIHPRYLEGDLGRIAGPALAKLSLDHVSVMLYSTDTRGVLARFRALQAAHPSLPLGLAQSVEIVLPPEESYAEQGRRAFLRALAAADTAAGEHPGFTGLFVQAWKDFLEVLP